MISDKIGPERFEGQEDVREVEQAGCVCCGVRGVGWESKRNSGGYEAVESCVVISVDSWLGSCDLERVIKGRGRTVLQH